MTFIIPDYSSYDEKQRIQFYHGLLRFIDKLSDVIHEESMAEKNEQMTPFDHGFMAGATVAAMAMEQNFSLEQLTLLR